MIYIKQFNKEDFIKALSIDWQKTSVIAKKVGCSRAFASRMLLQIEEAEYRWTKGGKTGTREWKLKEE